MIKLQDDIFALDGARNYVGLQEYILNCKQPTAEIIGVVWEMLEKVRLRGAYLISKLLTMQGTINPILSAGLLLGGQDVGNAEDIEEGKRLLRGQFDSQSPADQKSTYSLLEPIVLSILSLALTEKDSTPRMLRLLELLKQIVPELRTILDVEAASPLLDAETMRKRGRERARILSFASPPPGTPVRERRAIVAFRRLFFPHFKESRLFEQGPTLVAAMNAYGWSASFVGMEFDKQEENDCRIILETCMREQAEILVVDAVIFNFPTCVAILADLRKRMPALKLVGLYFDAWSMKSKDLRAVSVHMDVIWSTTPDLEAFKHEDFEGKMFVLPYARGGDYGGPILPILSKMTFIGGVAGYNWHRALWIAAMRAEGMPVDSHMTPFAADGLPAVESYLMYMRRLADSRCSINFSMRQNLTFSVTGRTFETVAAGALLVQERCPELDCYFVEGEHYLGFSTFSELRAVGQFIKDYPAEAEKIRRAGYNFYRERYHDDKLIGYLDHALYGVHSWPVPLKPVKEVTHA